ncbi:MAG: hypothetical protein ACHQ15_06445 [Candidatus Limnocylindrales bacterium]
MSYIRRFFLFLYDFLVGDAWELFVGPILALALAWLLLQAGVAPVLVGGLLFVSVLAVGVAHIVIALRSS